MSRWPRLSLRPWKPTTHAAPFAVMTDVALRQVVRERVDEHVWVHGLVVLAILGQAHRIAAAPLEAPLDPPRAVGQLVSPRRSSSVSMKKPASAWTGRSGERSAFPARRDRCRRRPCTRRARTTRSCSRSGGRSAGSRARSAGRLFCTAKLPARSPTVAGRPAYSGCSSQSRSCAFQAVATGTPRRSIAFRNCSCASPVRMPLPASTTGRSRGPEPGDEFVAPGGARVHGRSPRHGRTRLPRGRTASSASWSMRRGLHVQRDVQPHGAGAPGRGEMHRPLEVVADRGRIGDHHGVLGDGRYDRDDVCLLVAELPRGRPVEATVVSKRTWPDR